LALVRFWFLRRDGGISLTVPGEYVMLRKSLIPCVAVAALCLIVNVQQAQAQRRGGGMMGRGPQGVNDLQIAGNGAVQKELSLKPDQVEKLKDLSQDVREEMMQQLQSAGIDFAGMRDLSGEERAKKMAEVQAKMAEIQKGINEKFMPKLAETLDKSQLARVHEIAVQAAGAQALLDAGVQKELAITGDQKEKLVSINKDFAGKLAGLGRGGDPAERASKMHELNEEQTAKATEVLTKDQQAQFTKLKGKPFDTKLLRPARGGRRASTAAGQ
jgi:Spy/CpxP family protein refolding chaperone